MKAERWLLPRFKLRDKNPCIGVPWLNVA